ncbi:MAG: RimK family protein [Legionellales bacterium]|nr:RimK family protein [Legionellales bacterium]
MQIIIVTDDVPYWSFLKEFPIIQAEDYLKGGPYQSKSMRVINLCRSYAYQTIGYYVSLFALAQDQKISPSIQTIQDCTDPTLSKQFLAEIDEHIQKDLCDIKEDEISFNIYFGGCSQACFASLAKKIHEMFPLPLLHLCLSKKDTIWSVKTLSILVTQDIPSDDTEFVQQMARSYLTKNRIYSDYHKKQYHFHLAILTDPEDKTAPSNQKALDKFADAGESLGIQVDFIGKNDIKILPEYAGLFIRTGTNVNHYTYEFARYAAQENLVVIDDPQSIVKCGSKVYQALAFQTNNIRTPHTTIVSKYQKAPISVPFPCVIKRPDSALCLDMFKANNKQELKEALNQLFKFSDLVIIQSFLPTDFDWRIGVLDRKPLYAVRYYMAKGHWQIVNWAAPTEQEEIGVHESVPLKDVPEGVIQIALRAANLIGDGLYGVDIKSRDNEHYVIEVNDNPGIDAGDEDRCLGDELYRKIMRVFLQRMQAKHGWHAMPHYDQSQMEGVVDNT